MNSYKSCFCVFFSFVWSWFLPVAFRNYWLYADQRFYVSRTNWLWRKVIICDDWIFLIRIISKWKFAIVVTAHKIHKLLSINFVKHSCYFSKGCWDFVSVSSCNITLLFATVRSSRENAVQIIYIKTLQRLKLYPIRMGCRSIRHKLLIFLVACYTWKGKLT